MRPPTNKSAPGGNTEGADYQTTDVGNRSTTLGSTAFVSIRDQVAAGIVTTTRKCDPFGCWCHTGSTVTWPLTHDQEMGRMFREIRRLEVEQGPVL